MPNLRDLERQSGLLRLLVNLLDHDSYVTKLLKEYDIPNNQLISSSRQLKELGLVKTRIDKSSHPYKNILSLTDKGKKVAKHLKEIEEILEDER
jgi:predicted transcriptional regulator